MPDLLNIFPHLNASLNALAGVLLLVGYWLIKVRPDSSHLREMTLAWDEQEIQDQRRRREKAHKVVMLSAFATSCVFLVCYLTYHFVVKPEGHTKFPSYPPAAVRYTYYGILLTHVLLAAAVPFLALRTIYLGLKDRRAPHRKWAKITFPIWLYVSVTGVIVYLMLYQWFPAK